MTLLGIVLKDTFGVFHGPPFGEVPSTRTRPSPLDRVTRSKGNPKVFTANAGLSFPSNRCPLAIGD